MNADKAALAVIGVAEVFQIMAANLPSPTTMRTGGCEPARIQQLQRGLIVGGTTAILLTAGIAYFTAKEDKGAAKFLLFGSLAALALFVYESLRAIELAKQSGKVGKGF